MPGVGIRSMQERAAELGGRCDVGPSGAGGRVCVTLPLERA
jgi:signal transduction histidine kinase